MTRTKRLTREHRGEPPQAISTIPAPVADLDPYSSLVIRAFTLAESERTRRNLPPREPLGVPQIIITLSPDRGSLQAELPGANGSRRKLPFRADGKDFYFSILRILQAQLRQEIEIGLDGNPTEAQVKHWHEHQIFTNPACRFCLAEGRTQALRAKRDRLTGASAAAGTPPIRVIGKKAKQISSRRRLDQSLEELGL